MRNASLQITFKHGRSSIQQKLFTKKFTSNTIANLTTYADLIPELPKRMLMANSSRYFMTSNNLSVHATSSSSVDFELEAADEEDADEEGKGIM